MILESLPTRQLHRTHLIVGIIKSAKSDLIVEKAVELGVARIHFFYGERSQNPLSGEKLKERVERLRRVRDAAVRQSFTPELPDIQAHSTLNEALAEIHGSPKNLPSHGQRRLLLRAPQRSPQEVSDDHLHIEQLPVITEFFRCPTHSRKNSGRELENIGKSVESKVSVESYLLIGPEGGVTGSELEVSRSYRYVEASLGPNVLRTETAVILACGLVQLLGDSYVSSP